MADKVGEEEEVVEAEEEVEMYSTTDYLMNLHLKQL